MPCDATPLLPLRHLPLLTPDELPIVYAYIFRRRAATLRHDADMLTLMAMPPMKIRYASAVDITLLRQPPPPLLLNAINAYDADYDIYDAIAAIIADTPMFVNIRCRDNIYAAPPRHTPYDTPITRRLPLVSLAAAITFTPLRAIGLVYAIATCCRRLIRHAT